MKFYRKKEVLKSCTKYNCKKRNKTMIKKLHIIKTIEMSIHNTRRK